MRSSMPKEHGFVDVKRTGRQRYWETDNTSDFGRPTKFSKSLCQGHSLPHHSQPPKHKNGGNPRSRPNFAKKERQAKRNTERETIKGKQRKKKKQRERKTMTNRKKVRHRQ